MSLSEALNEDWECENQQRKFGNPNDIVSDGWDLLSRKSINMFPTVDRTAHKESLLLDDDDCDWTGHRSRWVVAVPAGPTIVLPDTVLVSEFPGEPYVVDSPFLVEIEAAGGEHLARFREANIGMTGESRQDALGNLLAEILDTFEIYESREGRLGPGPRRQLEVLRRHIRARA